MADACIWLAAAIACFSLYRGNRTSIALLASFMLSSWLIWAKVPFNVPTWVMIDIAVILALLRSGMTYADLAIIALFIPAWVGYFLPSPFCFWLSWSVVITQFLLTAPKCKPISFAVSIKIKSNVNDTFRMVTVC